MNCVDLPLFFYFSNPKNAQSWLQRKERLPSGNWEVKPVILPSAKKNSHTSSAKNGTEKNGHTEGNGHSNLLFADPALVTTAKTECSIKKAVVKKTSKKTVSTAAKKKQLLKKNNYCKKSLETEGLQKIIFQIGYRTESAGLFYCG